jgi:Putative amidase domain
MALDRNAMMKFAAEHWNSPCEDFIYSRLWPGDVVQVEHERRKLQAAGKLPGSGWKAVILPALDSDNNPIRARERGCFIRPNSTGEEIIANFKPAELTGKFDIVPFYTKGDADGDGFEDCAHFASQCLSAGGIRIDTGSVPTLIKQLRFGAYAQVTRTLGLEVTLEQGERIMATGVMQPGDVVAYVLVDGSKRSYNHSTIYTGFDTKNKVHRITCHTTSRFHDAYYDDTWNLTTESDWIYTLVHFSDDIFPALPKPLLLQVTAPGESAVYHLIANGYAKRGATKNAPAGIHPSDVGYWVWLPKKHALIVFWPKDGEVVSFDHVTSMTNEGLAGAHTITIDGTRGDFEVL